MESEEKKAGIYILQDLRNNMVVNSTYLIFTTYMPDWVLEDPATQKHQGQKQESLTYKKELAPSIQKTRKRVISKTKLLYNSTLFQPHTTEKSMSEPRLLPSGASRFPPLHYWNKVFSCPSPTRAITRKLSLK